MHVFCPLPAIGLSGGRTGQNIAHKSTFLPTDFPYGKFLNSFLVDTKKEFVLSKQLLRSGTSVGAMVREAEHPETKPDFIHKMAIAQKKINETIYWLELLAETNFLTKEQFGSINADAEELIKLVTAILKSTKANLKN